MFTPRNIPFYLQGNKQASAPVLPQGREFNAPGPAPRHTPIEELARGAQQLLDIFASNGYALKVPARCVTCH